MFTLVLQETETELYNIIMFRKKLTKIKTEMISITKISLQLTDAFAKLVFRRLIAFATRPAL